MIEDPEHKEWRSYRSYLRESEGNSNSQIAFALNLLNGDRQAFIAFHALEDEHYLTRGL